MVPFSSVATSLATSATGSFVIPAHARLRALLAQHPRHPQVRVEQERIDPLRPHDGIEDQPVGVLREQPRVLLGDERPVGHAHQRDLLDAQRLTQRLEVARRVDRRIERPARPDLRCAVGELLWHDRGEPVLALDHGAAQRSGVTRAALIQDGQAIALERRLQAQDERLRRADRRLAGTAGQRHQDRPCGRDAPLDGVLDGDRPRNAPRVVQRDRDRGAGEAGLALARLRLRGLCGRGERQRQRQREEWDAGHGTRHGRRP